MPFLSFKALNGLEYTWRTAFPHRNLPRGVQVGKVLNSALSQQLPPKTDRTEGSSMVCGLRLGGGGYCGEDKVQNSELFSTCTPLNCLAIKIFWRECPVNTAAYWGSASSYCKRGFSIVEACNATPSPNKPVLPPPYIPFGEVAFRSVQVGAWAVCVLVCLIESVLIVLLLVLIGDGLIKK